MREGEILWRQGEPAGRWCSSSRAASRCRCTCPGDREVEIARSGPGEMVGELALLDGGVHTMSVRAIGPTTVLVLNGADFAALLARHVPSAITAEAAAGRRS